MDDTEVCEQEANQSGSRCSLENRRVSAANILPFCNQLEKFIHYIESIRDLNFLTYEYPSVLQNRLNNSARKLKIILAEVQEARMNAERLKIQRNSIKREKEGVKKILKRIRDDEVREMERVILLYDKPMFSRWENVKNTHKPGVLEGILSDITGKKLALENLSILVTRKLNQIQVFQPLKIGIENTENSPASIRENTIIPLPFPSFGAPLSPTFAPPPPPPFPPQLALPAPSPVPHSVTHIPKRSHTQRLTIQRRRRLERRDENFERSCIVTPNTGDLALIPLTLSDRPNNLTSNFHATTPSTASDSDHNVVLENSPSSIPAPRILSNNNTILNINNNDEASDPGMEFQSEMRTVLQALFGDLRSTPTLLDTDSTSSNVAEPEDVSNSNREIELYTLRKTQ